jgi:itaconate CoA-transferase
MQKPLDGFLVVSLEQAVAAPMCSCRLADAGARVIKIERPEGDFARGYDNLVHGESAYFIWLNRGKESAVLDLNGKADKAVLESILRKADVFIQNLKPGALKKLGFSIERLHQDYPSLILCSISGYGESGPYAGRKAYDLLIQADSGLASITGGPERAARVGVSVVDIATGLNAYEAILEALLLRGRTGKGSVLSVSMFAAMADWMTVPLLQSEAGKPPRRMGLAHPSIAPYGVFKTKDGIDILISIQNDREWRLLAEKVLANPALAQDAHFARNVDRVARRAETDGLVADAFGARMAGELTAALAAADVAFAPVTDMGGLAKHPHLERITVSTPTGPATYPRPPAHWDGTQRSYGAVPALGQHTGAIRAEFLSGPSRIIGADA